MKNQEDKRGYLHENFKLFHLKDQIMQNFENHYHEFDKIVIFLSGNVTYIVEGKSYYLKPWDILLINHHDIHKALIDSSIPYERIIIWVNQTYIDTYNRHGVDLSICFQLADERSFNLVRLDNSLQNHIKQLLNELEVCISSIAYASELMTDTLFIQFLIYLNRVLLDNKNTFNSSSYRYDPKIEELMSFINANLDKDLSIQNLSDNLYISKYYLMHKFKIETGYTIHNYILQKRLLMAIDLIKKNTPITIACLKCGFKDYSTFSRAFKKMFHKAPSELK